MLARVFSAQTSGLIPEIITIEVDVSRGLYSFSIVGLPDKVVEEAKERLTAAIKNAGFPSPQRGNKKVIVSLAPADIKKEGPLFDLAIALGNLLASDDISFDPTGKLFLGELALSGEIRPVRGALLITQKARDAGFSEIFLPKENAREAALIDKITVYGVSHIKDVIHHLDISEKHEEKKLAPQPKTKIKVFTQNPESVVDFADIKGQETAKRAVEIAASGGHNIALFGPPGVGKTLLAKALVSILPPLSPTDVLSVTGIHSAHGTLKDGDIITEPPYQAPHHTASYAALVGGGTWPKPGAITLSHRGVLFLDEFPEFEKRVIDALRQPLEEKHISIARAKERAVFPADFLLVAAMNLCPCGNTGKKRTAPAHQHLLHDIEEKFLVRL